MPNTREKLIDLRQEAEKIAYNFCVGQETCDKCPYHEPKGCQEGMIADHLIANGVGFVPKWIPVTERLPKKNGKYLCNYHFGEYPTMTFTRVLDYYATDIVPHFQHTLGDGSMKVTHWMPLPPPPKGE